MEKRELFKNIDNFETNSDLFINFAFFKFVELLGKPLLEKMSKEYYYSNYKAFFDNLKVKCNFKEESKGNAYLYLIFNEDDYCSDFNTYVYSKLYINGKEIKLNGKEDRYVSNSNSPRIKLSKKTLNKIRNMHFNGKSYTGWELYFDNDSMNNPVLTSLINLYLNNKFIDRADYKEKRNSFVKKVTSDPKAGENGNDFFEIDANGNNRIKYENLQIGEIYFFQGPPGTGKTYAINRIVEQNDNEVRKFDRIIISSSVHVAINNIIERIMGSKDIDEDDYYHKYFDLYQYITVLYSNRALSKIESSPVSELIELDKILDEELYEKAERIYQVRKKNTKKLINDFDEKIDSLDQGNFKSNIQYLKENGIKNIKGEKFKKIFDILNNSDEEYIDYEKAIELTKELNDRYNNEFVKESNIDWGISNYSEAIKNYSNVIFCTLDNLHTELERQKKSDRILVIIDEASKSNIINYLLLLNYIDNITLLILGDPKQLNSALVFDSNVDKYSKIMTAFYSLNQVSPFKNNQARYKNAVVEKMKEILFDIEKHKSNKPSKDVLSKIEINKSNKMVNNYPDLLGYNYYSKEKTKMWRDILSETFYETLFEQSAPSRKKLLNVHRRSRREIFELSKFLYGSSYILGDKEHNDNLLIPNYDVITKIVVDDLKDGIGKIKQIIKEWKRQKNKNDEDMSLGIITFYNDYKKEFENNIDDINNNDVSVFTVDSAQGEEFTTVILYFDVNKNDNVTEFAVNYHRINVAVSRAREQLIIIQTKSFIDEYNKKKKDPSVILDHETKKFIDKIIANRGDSNE